jgi:hypothetical protein
MTAEDFPDPLEACIEKFWKDNPELKRQILKDWYSNGVISAASNEAGLAAVGAWLRTDQRGAEQGTGR